MSTRIETRFLRNKNLIPIPKLTNITIIGAGGIGSFVLQGLTMMGWKCIHIWDNDLVSPHNLSTTAYPLNTQDIPKVEAANIIHSMYSENWQTLKTYNDMFTKNSKIEPNMIVCTDDMESRKMIYNRWKELNKGFFIDLRMGATTVEMVTMTPGNDTYDKYWIATNDVPEAPCSQKHTVFATQHISSLGLSQTYNIVAKLAYFDYIWTSLNPKLVEFGTLMRPNSKGDGYATSRNQSEESVSRLERNASRDDIFLHRSA